MHKEILIKICKFGENRQNEKIDQRSPSKSNINPTSKCYHGVNNRKTILVVTYFLMPKSVESVNLIRLYEDVFKKSNFCTSESQLKYLTKNQLLFGTKCMSNILCVI